LLLLLLLPLLQMVLSRHRFDLTEALLELCSSLQGELLQSQTQWGWSATGCSEYFVEATAATAAHASASRQAPHILDRKKVAFNTCRLRDERRDTGSWCARSIVAARLAYNFCGGGSTDQLQQLVLLPPTGPAWEKRTHGSVSFITGAAITAGFDENFAWRKNAQALRDLSLGKDGLASCDGDLVLSHEDSHPRQAQRRDISEWCHGAQLGHTLVKLPALLFLQQTQVVVAAELPEHCAIWTSRNRGRGTPALAVRRPKDWELSERGPAAEPNNQRLCAIRLHGDRWTIALRRLVVLKNRHGALDHNVEGLADCALEEDNLIGTVGAPNEAAAHLRTQGGCEWAEELVL
jgi:hypothetical protein